MYCSIIVVVHNSPINILNYFVNSINIIKRNIEIIIVDNASKNEIYQIKLPYVKIFKNKKNIGFARACNQGAKIAKGEFLLFLNPDTEIKSKDFFQLLLNFAKSKKNLGAVGVKVFNSNETLQPSIGKFPTLFNIIFDRLPILNKNYGVQLRDKNLYQFTHEVDWISASCLFIKRDVFNKIGGFSEDIFMYGEDYDLCFRLQKQGYKNYFFPKVEITHADTGKNNPLRKPHKYYSMRKGFLIFFKKNRSFIEYFLLKYITKLEALFMLLLLGLRKVKTVKEKMLWKEYLLKTLKFNISFLRKPQKVKV